MQLTKGAIGNLINRYKAVLKKCHLMNTFGSLAVAGMLVMGGAGMAVAAEDVPLEGKNNYDSKTEVKHLMGGWLVNDAATAEAAKGDITLTVTGGNISEIIGGSYVKANSAFNETLTHGTITTTISGSTTSSQFVVGGSKIANSENAHLKTGDISLTIKGGTFGTKDNTGGYELVMGGNYLKADKSAADKSTAQAGDISVKIEGGEFHASVVGGSTAHVYPSNGENIPNLSVTDGSTSVTITGGTFNPSETNLIDANGGINLKAAVIGGGLAYGANTNSVLDAGSSVTIDGEKTAVNGKVVAGSVVAEDGYAAVVHGNTTLTMQNGTVSDDLVGGGMVQDAAKLPATTAGAETGENPNAQKQPDHNLIVTGNAGVTVAGGTATGEIVGGNYVRGNGSARVANSLVTITGGEFASDTANKAQYVIGGNKSMAYEGDITDTLVKKNSGVLVDGAVKIVDGAVVGGSMAKAEKDGKATATVAGNSGVQVDKGTLAGVVGGGIAETYYNASATAESTVDGTSSVTINGGTINGIAYGAVADNAGTSSAAVVGGGLANGAGSSASVTNTSVTIAGGKIDGKVVAGGLAINGGTTTARGNTLLTMTDGAVSGDLIGGNLLEKDGKEGSGIAGSTVNVKGGTVAGEIYGGSYVRNTAATSKVNNTTVNISGGTIGATEPQGWAQYVVGGGKAMSNATTTESSVMGTAAVNISGGDITRGAVVGGGFARAQGAGGSATANVEDSVVNLTGGSLVGVVGGGLAENLNTETATAKVTNASLTIGGNATVNGIIYKGNDAGNTSPSAAVIGGGLAYSKNGSKATASVGTANTIINGGTINGDVYAGGMADGAGAQANVDNASLTISGGTITGNVYAGGYALKNGMADVTTANVTLKGGSISGKVTVGKATNAIITLDGTGAEVTGDFEGNKNSTLAFNNYNATFNSTATGFDTLSVAEGSNVEMANLSTGAKGGEADKGFFGSNDVKVNGKGTVKAENVTAADGKTITVADGSTLDAGTLTTKDNGKAKTEGLGSTLVIGNAQDALDSINTASLSSTAGSEIKFTGLGESVAASDITKKLQGDSTGIVNVGDTKVNGLTAQDGKVAYTTWSTSGLSGITNDELKKATLTDVPSTAVDKTGSFGSAQLATGTELTVGINGNLTLTGLDSSSSNFVSTSEGKKAGAAIADNATLTLGDNTYAGNKSIGDIRIGTNATLNVLGQSAAAATVNSGAITTAATGTEVNAKNVTLNVAGHIGAAGSAIGTITADAANIKATGDVTAGGITLAKGGSVTSDKNITVNSSIENADGTLQAGEDITATDLKQAAGGKLTVVADGTIEAAGITATNVVAKTLAASGAVAVDGGVLNLTGTDTDASTVADLKLTNGTQATVADLNLTGAGTITVGTGDDTVGGTTLSAKHIDLNDGMLIVDPDWGLPSSNVAVASLSETASETDVTVNGSVGVGQNSYLALGTADTSWLPGVVAGYTNGTGLSQTGITAAMGLYKGITIGTGKALLVDGSKVGDSDGTPSYDAGSLEAYLTDSANANSATFADNSLLVINGQNIYGDTAAISFENNANTLKVGQDAKLLVTDAVDGQNYTIVDNVTTVEDGDGTSIGDGNAVWTGGSLNSTTDMISLGDAVFDGTNNKVTTTATRNDAHTVFPNLSDGMANAVNDLYTGHDGATAGDPKWDYADVNSADMGVRFLSRATDNRFLGSDKDAAAATIESAARIAFAGAVPQMTKMASDAGTNAVVNRLGFANPADGAQAMDAEGKIVDRNTTGFALWIAPLWQSQHGWGMEADNLDYGFNGNLGGVSLGADYTFENAIRAGITFNIGGGYAESSGGDLNSTENRMSFWGLGAYAGWNYENFGLMADVSYTSTWNDLKQDVDSRMGMGDLEADVQASAISAGLRAEYKLETSVLDVIPHIGVRYMSLNTWGFDAESNGGTVLEGDGFHQDIWTFPVGVTFTKDFTLDSGWSFKPSIDFSVIPAAGDIKAKQDVAFTGLPGSYEVETQMMDYLTWQGGVGLEMGNDTMSFGVNYTLQAGQHTTGHGVFGSFRYEF